MNVYIFIEQTWFVNISIPRNSNICESEPCGGAGGRGRGA